MNARAARRREATDELIDRVAIEEFLERHGRERLSPVAVVIAAYKEAENIAQVVSAIPSRLGGEEASVLVVVDGEDDGTGDIVRGLGAFAVVAAVNRGQGAALRLGYRVAREQGARWIVTADADGQTDPDDLAVALAPVMAGEKDFVNGSRRLGETHGRDAVRNLGVVVYAGVISLLTRTKVSDPANPVRAFPAELTASLRLEEPQYQASELLIGALARGVRYGEVPVTMRSRQKGASKKGGNVLYGLRYGRVVLRTFRREYLNGRSSVPPRVKTPAVR